MPPLAPNREALVARLTSELRPRAEISAAVLHGSFLRGEPYRDIDVALWLDDRLVAPSERFRYGLDLGVRLQLDLGAPVDVRILNDAPLGFRYHALAGRCLIARDAELLDELRARTWDEYFDFQPLARQYLREVLGG